MADNHMNVDEQPDVGRPNGPTEDTLSPFARDLWVDYLDYCETLFKRHDYQKEFGCRSLDEVRDVPLDM